MVHRGSLEKERPWKAVVDRPYAAGLFVSVWMVGPFYETRLSTWMFFVWTISAVAAARLVENLVADFWRKGAVYAIALLVIILQFFYVISLPTPLFRLYVFSVAVVGLLLCVWRIGKSTRRGDRRRCTWLLRLGVGIFAGVVVAELAGYSGFSSYLLDSALKTLFVLLLGWMFVLLARGGLMLAVRAPVIRKIPVLQQNANVIVGRSMLLIGLLIGVFVTAYLLVTWRIYEGSPMTVFRDLMSFGFSIGSWRLTVGVFISAAAVLYGAFLISWTVQAVLMHGVLARRQVQAGVRMSIGKLVHYALILVGFLAAVVTLGFDLKNVTIIGGALGIGVGFGLQNIVNNFVSGIILLFERPIKMGDYIQFGQQWGRVTKLGLRATVVRLRDRSEIVVPNSELISQRVSNLTLTDRFVRIIIPVGVAYGSDVSLVLNTLRECAEANPAVATTPAPKAFFMGFGRSSLDFELRVWVSDIDNRREVQSDLHQEIDRRFRELGIEIPFPQRDLHIRSSESSTQGETLPVASEEGGS
jgi:small-conductance mechanosensitive channel